MRAQTMTRVIDELFWRVRREGVAISTAQAIDASRAAVLVGMDDRDLFRETLACVLAQSEIDRRRFERAFNAFFDSKSRALDFWDRLESLGFTANEQDTLRELLDAMTSITGDGNSLAPLLERGAALDRLLRTAGVERTFDAMQSPMQVGFFSHRAIDRVGITEARTSLAALRVQLRDALGARGDALADALEKELAAAADDVRAHVQRSFSRREEEIQSRGDAIESRSFTSLSDSESPKCGARFVRSPNDCVAVNAFAAVALVAARSIRTRRCDAHFRHPAFPSPPSAKPNDVSAPDYFYCAT